MPRVSALAILALAALPCCARAGGGLGGRSPAAQVNGAIVTVAQVEARLAADRGATADLAAAGEPAVTAAKRALLERMIAETLLVQEAARRGVAVDALRASLADDVQVSDSDVDVSLALARSYTGPDPVVQARCRRLLAGSDAEARERMRAFVQAEREWVALANFVAPLRARAEISVDAFLPPATEPPS